MVIDYIIILKGIIKMNNNEIRKSFKITKELNDLLQYAIKITGTTETSLIKVALFEYLKGIQLWFIVKISLTKNILLVIILK